MCISVIRGKNYVLESRFIYQSNVLFLEVLLTTDIYQRVIAAKIYIDENLHEPLDLEQISRQAFFSRFHFHRLFTHIYRKTPHQYLTRARLDAAKALLEKEGLSITDVCNCVGFESLGSFSLLFKKGTGHTPQYYRNMAFLKKRLSKQQPTKYIPHCYVKSWALVQESKIR